MWHLCGWRCGGWFCHTRVLCCAAFTPLAFCRLGRTFSHAYQTRISQCFAHMAWLHIFWFTSFCVMSSHLSLVPGADVLVFLLFSMSSLSGFLHFYIGTFGSSTFGARRSISYNLYYDMSFAFYFTFYVYAAWRRVCS